MSAARIDVNDVRLELRIEHVMERYGLHARKRGRAIRLPECPSCRLHSSSKAVWINTRKDTWGHFGHGKREGGSCYGDAFDLIAVCESLDRRRDWQRILEIAAKIAGVDARPLTDAERAERRAYHERMRAERDRLAEIEETKMLMEAKLKATATWQRLASQRRNIALRAYLRTARKLNPEPLIEADHVRSDLLGNVHVPLWSLDDGELVNVVSRAISEKNTGPKVLGLAGCPTAGTLCGRLAEIQAGSKVLIAEGVIDTLTAIQLWPDHVVLGAHGAGRLTQIVEAAAPIVHAKGGRLVLVPDGDDVGQRCAINAGEAALDAGLEMDETLVVVDLGDHHDLNDAHCAGWKP